MATPLIPTTVTDKNGRTTTVHKKQDPRSSSKALGVPAPTLAPKTTNSTAGTPLTPPSPITEAQSAEVRAWQQQMLEGFGYNARAKAACLMPLDPESEALAWRVIKTGRVHDKAIASIIYASQLQRHMFKGSDASLTELRAHLLVAERVGQLAPSVANVAGPILGSRVHRTMRGYGYSPRQEDRSSLREIGTEEKLASIAAVTIFLTHAANEEWDNQFKDGDYKDEGKANKGTWMTNHALKAYIVENPENVHRVIEYMSTRPVGKSIKDARAIIQYAEEAKELGALDQGWL